VTLCRRQGGEGALVRRDSNGAVYYVHFAAPSGRDADREPAPPLRPGPVPEAAPPETRHAVYGRFLERLTLSKPHRNALLRRGLTEAAVETNAYRSAPNNPVKRQHLLAGLAEEFGRETLLAVPGFYEADGSLALSAPEGLLIPVRGVGGSVVALQARPDGRRTGGPKYLWVSSRRHGGPTCGAPCHVPAGVDIEVPVVRLTEGVLKADIASLLSGTPTLSAPGVGNWRVCLPVLEMIGARTVRVGFDSDASVNASVALATVDCCETLARSGYEVEPERCDPEAKGIDDALAAGKTVEVLTGDAAAAFVAGLAAAHDIPARGPEPDANGRPVKPRFDARPDGRNRTWLTANVGGKVVHADQLNIRKVKERDRFVRDLAKCCPGVDEADAADELLELSGGPTLKVVGGQAEGDSPGAGREGPAGALSDLYAVVNGRLCRSVPTRDGAAVQIPLCNFVAEIVEEVTRDDGLEQSRRLSVEGTLHTGTPLSAVEVSPEEFARGDWPLTRWGTHAVVYAGPGNRDHLRAALQLRSPNPRKRTVHTATGWTRVDGQHAYVHAAGAIGPDGPLGSVSTEPPDALILYALPVPPEGDARRDAVRGQLRLLDRLAPDRVAFPLVATAVRAVLPGADFSTHLTGRTGCFKSELAALAQQHAGPGLDAKHLPASWSSTGNALEGIAFSARHALLVVDDFCPAGNAADVQRYHRDADRLFRGQGNRSGRHRLRSDGTPRPARPPRGVILSTGEDVPRGHSLRARMFVVEVGRSDVNPGRLTECQRDAAAGTYASAAAAYVRWIAGRFDEVSAGLKAEAVRLRDAVFTELGDGSHRRTPAVVADLVAGFALYLQFAREAGAVDDAQAEALLKRCRAALLDVADEQAALQASSDPAERYLALLASVLSSGRAHVAGPDGEPPAGSPQACGWRPSSDPRAPGSAWEPRGERIGWIDGDNLYLDPEAAYGEVQRLGNTQGEPLAVSRDTLHRRLKERGLLASTDTKRKKILIRHVLERARHYVLHLFAGRVIPTVPEGPKGPQGPDDTEPVDTTGVAGGPISPEATTVGPCERPTVTDVGLSRRPMTPDVDTEGPRATHTETDVCDPNGPRGPFGPSFPPQGATGGANERGGEEVL
jgi:hypothetical protein